MSSRRRAVPLELDVTDYDSIQQAAAQGLEAYGRIDILVNNAGINVRAPLAEFTDEDFDRVQKVNLYGVFHCCRAVAPGMIDPTVRIGREIRIVTEDTLRGDV